MRWGHFRKNIFQPRITIKHFILYSPFTSVMSSFVRLILFIIQDSAWAIAEINLRTPFWGSLTLCSSSSSISHISLHSVFKLLWVVSRPGPQISTTRALPWFQNKSVEWRGYALSCENVDIGCIKADDAHLRVFEYKERSLSHSVSKILTASKLCLSCI